MNSKWFKTIGITIGTAVAAGAIVVLAAGAVAFAQGPTPGTTPAAPAAPNSQTAPMGRMPGGFGGFGFGPEMGEFGRGQNSLMAAFAKALNTTESNLVTELQSGKTLSELAQQANVNTATVVSDYIKPYQVALNTAVINKQFTQAQADARVAVLKADAEALLDHKFDANSFQQPGPGGQKGPGEFGGFGRHSGFGPGGFGPGGGQGGQQPQQPPQQQQQQQQQQQPTPSGI